MELDPKYASAIVRRYAAFRQSIDGIRCLRDGEEVPCSEIYCPTGDDLSYKDERLQEGGLTA
jgi:hypothetical protein